MSAISKRTKSRTFSSIAATRYLADAFSIAADWHSTQKRKGTSIPYVSHLMSVSALVMEHGGDPEQVVAALLHDSLEDSECAEEASQRKEAIRRQFGDRVVHIVECCTDGTPGSDGLKAEWLARKQLYLKHLDAVDVDVLLVSAADKLHNARAILSDLRLIGDEVFNRFNAGKDGSLWYYRELARIFNSRLPGPLSAELDRTVASMIDLAQQEKGSRPEPRGSHPRSQSDIPVKLSARGRKANTR